jgi:hypothetical protein
MEDFEQQDQFKTKWKLSKHKKNFKKTLKTGRIKVLVEISKILYSSSMLQIDMSSSMSILIKIMDKGYLFLSFTNHFFCAKAYILP